MRPSASPLTPSRSARATFSSNSKRSSKGRPERVRCGASAPMRASSVPRARASWASVAVRTGGDDSANGSDVGLGPGRGEAGIPACDELAVGDDAADRG